MPRPCSRTPRTYEHVEPDSVGNRRKVLVSDQAGKSNILAELERLGVRVSGSDPRVMRLLDEVKERESLGYAYEAADASFVLLARRILGEVPHYFDVERFRVNVERRYNSEGQRITVSEAVVKVTIDGASLMSVAEGTGPVHALDLALRKDLGKYQRYISDLELLDYRVRIFQGGSDAVTRVLIECGDGAGRALVHGGRFGQHHRCVVPGAGRCHQLPAADGRGGVSDPATGARSRSRRDCRDPGPEPTRSACRNGRSSPNRRWAGPRAFRGGSARLAGRRQ